MGKRIDFGFSWSEVVACRYFGSSPSIPEDIGWEALGALECLWPEYIDTVLPEATKVNIIPGVIDIGITLGARENLVGVKRLIRVQ